MLKTLAVSTLLLGSAIAFARPAAARDRDDYRNNNNNRDRDHHASNYDRRDNRERGEWQEHERFENRRVPYASSYRSGYRDQRFGYGDQRYGYYDRFGNWCWY
jgi:hypothetical protein